MDTSTPPRTIGDNIRDLRKAKGFAVQRQFAKALGMDPSRVNELEKNRYKQPSTKVLQHVARVLGCTVDDLLKGVSQADSEPIQTGHSTAVRQPRDAGVTIRKSERKSVDAPRPHRYTSRTLGQSHVGQTGAHNERNDGVDDSWKLPADFIALLGIEDTADPEAIRERGHDLVHIATFLRTIGNRLISGETARPGEGLPSSTPRGRSAGGSLSVARPAKKA